MKNQYSIIFILSLLALAGCQSKQVESSSLGPEVTCGLAEPFSTMAMEMRQENVPKFFVKTIEYGVYLFQGRDMPELHHTFQDSIDLAYEQESAKSQQQKQAQLESFAQLAYEQCVKNFDQ